MSATLNDNYMSKLAFDFTPQIFRYLEDIIRLNDEELSDEIDHWIVIQAYVVPEKPSVKLEEINLNFWTYLQEISAIKMSDDNKIVIGKQIEGEVIKLSDNTNWLALSKYRIKVLDINKIKSILLNRNQKSVIRFKTLELIARDIGEMDSGVKLVKFLKECGVDSELIFYPNTKWRMIYDVLKLLATSPEPKDKKTLFTIIEEAVHPLMHNGSEAISVTVTERFNGLLKYDKLSIDKHGTLWAEIENEPWCEPEYQNKDGAYLAFECKMVFPNDIEKLYVYWNELIKITKFYFSNKKDQDDELNEIYFEIIETVQKTLTEDHCGSLKNKYKKPFNVIIGCEYEKKQSEDEILSTLYVFLGQITEVSVPTRDGIAEIKKTDNEFFERVNLYLSRFKEKSAIKEEQEEDCFSYEGGVTTSYEGSDLELFILKKILLEHKQRDDAGFLAKEFSFNNNSLESICRVINRMIEDKIFWLSANTKPERDDKKDIDGIEKKDGFLNWALVKELDENPQKMDSEENVVIFDTNMEDEIKLKGRIDISIEEFMNDKLFDEYCFPLTISKDEYNYAEQRLIMLEEISKNSSETMIIPLVDFRDSKIDVLKTLLALEKENILRIHRIGKKKG